MQITIDWGNLAAIITALVGVAIAVSSRRKNDAEASAVLAEATEKLLGPLNKKIGEQDEVIGELKFQVEQQTLQMRRQSTEMSELRQRVIEMSKGIDMLTAQIEAFGQEPIWKKPQKGKK